MEIGVELFVYAYIFLCICMLVFNITYIAYSKTDKKISYKSSEKWKADIIYQINLNNQNKTDNGYVKSLLKKLKKLKNLQQFEEALEDVKKRMPKELEKYLYLNREVFIQLWYYYSHKESMEKAFFAYVLSEYGTKDMYDKRIPEILSMYLMDKSIYCRENALCAVYKLGDAQAVASAFLMMERNNLPHNSKLLTDGLLGFTGDKESLAEVLVEKMEQFSPSLQVPIIDYIRNVSGNFCKTLYDMINGKKANEEVKISILRYFRKYRYEPAQGYIINCFNMDQGQDWQTAAVAASALDNYPTEEAVQALRRALSSSNWYVRNNAADSLLKQGVTYVDLLDIINGHDRYAREMIKYKMIQNR